MPKPKLNYSDFSDSGKLFSRPKQRKRPPTEGGGKLRDIEDIYL